MPELIEDGVTGFLVDHPGDVPDVIARLPRIDRAACAAHAHSRARFGADVMARRYDGLYRSIIRSLRASVSGAFSQAVK